MIESEEETFSCPNCGAEVKPKALSCKNCGSDSQTGWSLNSNEGLLEEEFDYGDSLEKEFGIEKVSKKKLPNWIGITGFTLLLLMLIFLFRQF